MSSETSSNATSPSATPPRSVRILKTDIPPGASLTLSLDVAALHTRNAVTTPVYVERSKRDGPVLLLMGGVHGDELNGIDIVRRFVHGRHHRPLRGTVVCIPVLNVFGFVHLSRKFPDGRDLNRVFPGAKGGSLASQFAYLFRTQILPDIDYVIDFHSGGADRVNVAQTRCNFSDDAAFRFARAFGAPFVVQSKSISRSIREAFHQAGKTAMIFEGGRSMHFDEAAIAIGVAGARRLMHYLEMGPPVPGADKPSILINRSRWIRAPSSGMWHPQVGYGAWVERGTVLGQVSDPFGGQVKPVRATWAGYVFCINVSPVINRGDALLHVSTSVIE